jgi:hypothetical protein
MTGDHNVQNQRRQIEVQPSAQAERREADAEPQAVQECGTPSETGGGFGAEARGGVSADWPRPSPNFEAQE